MMKIDVEGWESRVLAGGKEVFQPNRRTALAMYQCLENFGYRMFVYNLAKRNLLPEPVREKYPYNNLIATKDPEVVAFVDFLISFAILVGLMIWYAFVPGWQILLLPLFTAIAFITSFGVGVWITALNVKYRDFRYVIPFIVQIGLYVSPVGFSSAIIPDQWRLAYSLNPMVGVIDGFRWCILGGDSQIYWPGFWLSIAMAGFFLWLGIGQFRKMEKSCADLI
jgi:lipopolysaccharide transport system permease protein